MDLFEIQEEMLCNSKYMLKTFSREKEGIPLAFLRGMRYNIKAVCNDDWVPCDLSV